MVSRAGLAARRQTAADLPALPLCCRCWLCGALTFGRHGGQGGVGKSAATGSGRSDDRLAGMRSLNPAVNAEQHNKNQQALESVDRLNSLICLYMMAAPH